MYKNKFEHLDRYPMSPGFSRDLLGYQEGENSYTVNRLYGKKGSRSKPHTHPHCQFVYILSGKGIFLCGGEEIPVGPGDCLQIDSNVPHGFGYVEEDSEWLEIFTPAREDFKP